MLGIRHYRGCAIDLWCGNPQEFVADVQLDSLAGLADHRAKHIVILGGETRQASEQLTQLKDDLSGMHLPRRITFILPDLDSYKRYQTALFATFPEFDDE